MNTTTTGELKTVNNCWTIWEEMLEDGHRLATMGRPQDWGNPRWMYRVYILEAQGYRNIVHCWTDAPLNEYQHLERFAGVICQIMLPGWEVERSTREFMHEDDFWMDEWGKMPPYFQETNWEDDDYDEAEHE